MRFVNKIAVITGASRGLGEYIAGSFVKQGIKKLIILARNGEILSKAQSSLNKMRISSTQKIITKECDISSMSDIERFSELCFQETEKIDILVNNASVFGPIGYFEDVQLNEWVETIHVNYVGTATIIKYLLPLIKASERGKIINIVGGGASKPYGCLSGYATSKVAIVRFTEELAAELNKYNIDINCIAPGPLDTRFVDVMLNAGVEVLGKSLYDHVTNIRKEGGTSFELPSLLCHFLADSASNGISGKMLSARYDDIKLLIKNKDRLIKSDLYTLRRVSK
jgi:3-oxoacyl-[acyl-carrier protein] reductase